MKLENDLRDAMQGAEAEVRRGIAYLNDRIVPEVRSHTLEACRSAAGELRKLADRLERSGKPR